MDQWTVARGASGLVRSLTAPFNGESGELTPSAYSCSAPRLPKAYCDERSWTDRPVIVLWEIFVRTPETVTGLPGRAISGLTEVMLTETGTVTPGCRATATLAAASLSVRPQRASTHGARPPSQAIALAPLLVSSGRGMAEMLLRPAGRGKQACAELPAWSPSAQCRTSPSGPPPPPLPPSIPPPHPGPGCPNL